MDKLEIKYQYDTAVAFMESLTPGRSTQTISLRSLNFKWNTLQVECSIQTNQPRGRYWSRADW